MTYAPQTLRDLAAYWVSKKGVNLGIVGDLRHLAKGTSYHLGKDQLLSTAYSIQHPRDRAGLTNAASAIDLGKLNGSLGDLRRFSDYLAHRCLAGAPGTHDIREVIYSTGGQTVVGYKQGVSKLIPGFGDDSHLTHTHISYFRDSEKRDKRAIFRAYFEGPDTSTEEPDVPGIRLTDVEPGFVTVKDIPGVQAVNVADPTQRDGMQPGWKKPTIGKARVVAIGDNPNPFGADTAAESRHIVRILGGKDENGVEVELAVILAAQVDGPAAAPLPNCDSAVSAALDKLTAPVSALVTALEEARP
jgi:hypothetical protein